MHEILYLAIGSVIAKLMEDARKIGLSKQRGRRLKNYHGLYEAFNVHLPIGLALSAFILSHQVPHDYVYCLVLIMFGGIMTKCVFSGHRPERLSWQDSDARWGLIVPNGCALAAIVVTLVATNLYPVDNAPKKTTQNATVSQAVDQKPNE
jgi:hypothetical protein